MKKAYISPAVEHELFETADIITASMSFYEETYNGAGNGTMPEVYIAVKHPN